MTERAGLARRDPAEAPSPRVRPYSLTLGRTRFGRVLRVETLVSSSGCDGDGGPGGDSGRGTERTEDTGSASGVDRPNTTSSARSSTGAAAGSGRGRPRAAGRAAAGRARGAAAPRPRTASGGTRGLGGHVLPEVRAILELCRTVRSVAEVSALLGMPLGATRVLLSDLADQGRVRVYGTGDGASRPDRALLERVLSGLRTI